MQMLKILRIGFWIFVFVIGIMLTVSGIAEIRDRITGEDVTASYCNGLKFTIIGLFLIAICLASI